MSSQQTQLSSPTEAVTPRSPSTRHRGDTLTIPTSPRILADTRQTPGASGAPNNGRTDISQSGGGVGIQYAASVSRDFETAILDDDKSGTGENVIEPKMLSKMGRRGTRRRSRDPNQSRESSSSSRSSDTANSVDAFADQRRHRANTVGSNPGSEVDLSVHRTVSGGTSCRRPTLEGSIRDFKVDDDRVSRHVAADEEIAAAVEKASKACRIDFEELDEFTAELAKTKVARSLMAKRQDSVSSHILGLGKFDDLIMPGVPRITTEMATPGQSDNEAEGRGEDSDELFSEKKAAAAAFDAASKKTGSVATEPGRFGFFSSELEQTIHASELPGLLGPGETWQDLFDLPEDSGVWWLDVLNPTEDELEVLQRAFGIHRLTTEDIATQEAREKVELFHNYYFVNFRSFEQLDPSHENYMEPLNVYMVVFREGIVTITYKQAPHASNVRKRIGKLRDYMSLTADWICYAMIDNIVDCFAPPIQSIEHEADVIEEEVFVSRSDDLNPTLRHIGAARKKNNTLLRLLGGKADVIKGFAKRCNESYNVTPRGEIGLYLSDIQDHIVTMSSNLAHFETMLSRSHSNYLAQLSVDQIRTGNRANDVLAKITLLASILVPLNLICGLFGMNVNVPGKNADGLGWFFGLLGLILAIVVLCLIVARKMRLFP